MPATGQPTREGRATIFRMVSPEHICPFGVKAVELLREAGFDVDDRWLRSRGEVDEFKAAEDVDTTPLIFVEGERVGGYQELTRWIAGHSGAGGSDATRQS